MEYNIFRAPIDNDMYVKEEWFRAGYDKTVARAYETHLSCRATRADSHGRIQLNLGDTTGTEPLEKIEIRSRLSLSSPGIQNILSIDAIWTVDPHGLIKIRLNVKKDPEFPDLPRFGLRFFLPDSMNQVSWPRSTGSMKKHLVLKSACCPAYAADHASILSSYTLRFLAISTAVATSLSFFT